MADEILTVQKLKEILHYNPETGVFTWAQCRYKSRIGTQAGARHSKGYIFIAIGSRETRRKYYAHRLAWLYMTGEWPLTQVDHINGVRDDNRFRNLRDVPQSANMLNQHRAHPSSVSGKLGVSKLSNCNAYAARFTFQGQKITVGYFADPVEAKFEHDRVKSFMCGSPHAQTLKRLIEQKDLSPNGLRSVIDLLI